MNEQEKTVNEENLSKAIDSLIEEHFGKETAPEVDPKAELEKSNGQPDNSSAMNQLPKDTDVNANGGKDVIKAKKGEEEEEESEEMKKKTYKADAKKSKEAEEDNTESLIKSLTEENQQLQKSNDSLVKSFGDFQKSVNDKFENIGEIFKGMKYEIDQLRKSPVPRKSVKNVDEIKKSFEDTRTEESTPGSDIKKSEVSDAIESLVKSNSVSSSLMTEFEMYGKIQNPAHSRMVAAEVMRMRKQA